VLQQYRGRDRVDVPFPAARRATHFLDRSLSGGGRKTLVNEPDRKPAPFGQLRSNFPRLGTTLGFFAFLIERQADHEPLGLELAGAVEDLTDGRAFAGAAEDVAGGGRDGAGWVAHGESNASVTEVDCEEAHKSRT